MGVTKILTEGPAMLNESYVHLWAGLLNALVCMFEEGVDTSTPQVCVVCDIGMFFDTVRVSCNLYVIMIVKLRDLDNFNAKNIFII